jgi:hypothetical protein
MSVMARALRYKYGGSLRFPLNKIIRFIILPNTPKTHRNGPMYWLHIVATKSVVSPDWFPYHGSPIIELLSDKFCIADVFIYPVI